MVKSLAFGFGHVYGPIHVLYYVIVVWIIKCQRNARSGCTKAPDMPDIRLISMVKPTVGSIALVGRNPTFAYCGRSFLYRRINE